MDRRTCVNTLSALGLLPLLAKSMELPVIQRTIHSTGERLTAVGLGTWQTFDVSKDAKEKEPLLKVLKTLIEKGGRVVDSSPMYGRSEEVVGELSTTANINDKLFIATKVWTTGKESGIRQMNESFALLKRNKIDLMQIHNLVDWQTHLKTLQEWKQQGKIRYIGITHYNESAYASVEQIIKTESIDFLQINYSLLNRKAAERLLPLAEEKKIAVLINRPFEEGLLFNKVKGKDLPAWAKEFDCSTWGQFFLKFIIAHPAVTCVIPGTAKSHHMLDNVTSAYGGIPDQNHQKQMISLVETF